MPVLQVSRDGGAFVPLYVVMAPGSVTEFSIPSASIPTAGDESSRWSRA